jgi:NAD-dependent deacetylase
VPVLSISQAVRVEADGLIILPCPGGDRIIRRPVQIDRVYSNTTGLLKMERALQDIIKEVAESSRPITVLTGAGISAESGIPTFRGPEGYWTIGSSEYTPQEMATNRMFQKAPDEVWRWYLYRLAICQKAQPNAGHLALVEMETLFKDRFTLITQNVDGLHLLAGNSGKRTFQIHGNLFFMRCARECTEERYPLPFGLGRDSKKGGLTEEAKKILRCPKCKEWSRPHVLWFDEVYNETHYRYQSSLAVAERTELLIIVGTAGSTNLPNQVAWLVSRNDGILINIDTEKNLFANLALGSRRGFFLKEPSEKALPELVKQMKRYTSGSGPV